MTYFVHESPARDRARLHRVWCATCEAGRTSPEPDERWHGPFQTAEIARHAMTRLKRATMDLCADCEP